MSDSSKPVEAQRLRLFLTVVDCGGLAPAAAALRLPESALEQALTGLESRLGVPLLVRAPFALTDGGERLVPAARDLLGQLDGAAAGVERVRELQAGRLNLVTYPAFTVDPLVYLVARFRRRHPQIRVDVHHVRSGAFARDAVRSGLAELAVVDGAETHAATDLVLPVQENVLVGTVEMLRDLPDPVPREIAARLPLIFDAAEVNLLRAAQSGPADHLDAEVETNVVVDCSLPLATWRLVAAGVGVTVASRRVAMTRMPRAVVRRLDPPLLRRPAVVRRSDRLSPAAQAFIELSGASRPRD
jgi:DNA-binding transcriptional LysR family regulator